jgi:hypothetical protein
MTFRKNFHQVAKSDAKCKTYISSDFEQKERNIYLLEDDYRNEVLNLDNFR